jgi:hypothetical protein
MNIPDGHKFALLALSARHVDLPANGVDIGDGTVASGGHSLVMPPLWQDWLGSLAVERIGSASLVLTVTAPTTRPDVLDHENQQLQQQLEAIRAGLMIATHGLDVAEAQLLTGVRHRGEVDIRSSSTLARTFSIAGTPATPICVAQLQLAVRVARGLRTLSTDGARSDPGGAYGRLLRGINALYRAAEAPMLDVRLHQAVRVIEAIAMPIGKGNGAVSLASRERLFIGGGEKFPKHLNTLYQLRSKVEHMQDMEKAALEIWKSETLRPDELTVRLAKCASLAEALAHAALTQILSSPHVLTHFVSDAAIEQFWTTHAESLWQPLTSDVTKECLFDERAVQRRLNDDRA